MSGVLKRSGAAEFRHPNAFNVRFALRAAECRAIREMDPVPAKPVTYTLPDGSNATAAAQSSIGCHPGTWTIRVRFPRG